jgi:cell division septal protein FtsQ
MRSRSNITVSLRKKRRLGRMKKIGLWTLFILFFISLSILALTSDRLRIQNIVVSGNSAIPKSEIIAVANPELDIRHLGFIATDNFFLLERNALKDAILNNIKTIKTVGISFDGFNTIDISVSERMPENLWCEGTLQAAGNCFLMDNNGFIFASDTESTSSTQNFPEYFGLVQSANPVGEQYFASGRFSQIANLFSDLLNMGFAPVSFLATDTHEYQIDLSGGGLMYFNDTQSFADALTDLQALIDSGYIKTTPAFLNNLDYIDLRYGSKVDFMMKK